MRTIDSARRRAARSPNNAHTNPAANTAVNASNAESILFHLIGSRPDFIRHGIMNQIVMKRFLLLPVCLCLAQPPPPDTVLGTVGDSKITVADIQKLLGGLPPHIRQNYVKNPIEFLQQVLLFRHLAGEALKLGLDQRSPYKEMLDHARIQALVQSRIDEAANTISFTEDEQEKYYQQNQSKYVRARTKVIYIPFSLTPPPARGSGAAKILSEAEARAKAESLAKQARAGADFVALVKQHSQDQASVARDGDFEAMRQEDTKIPEEIRKAVFARKAGDVTDPIRLPNGYYLFRVEEIGPPPYGEMRTQIFDAMRQARHNDWFEAARKAVELKIDNVGVLAQIGSP